MTALERATFCPRPKVWPDAHALASTLRRDRLSISARYGHHHELCIGYSGRDHRQQDRLTSKRQTRRSGICAAPRKPVSAAGHARLQDVCAIEASAPGISGSIRHGHSQVMLFDCVKVSDLSAVVIFNPGIGCPMPQSRTGRIDRIFCGCKNRG